MTENAIFNNVLSSLIEKAAPRVTGAIRAASNKTGVDFAYLMEQANAESSFRDDLEAKTSSATGLFQFIERTWLQMVKKHGAKHGLGHLVDKTEDPAFRDEILELRKDPKKAAAMAAEFASDNKKHLLQHSGLKHDEIGATELYFAHFLGASGAASFLKAHKKNPLETAANLFPEAANANRNVFFDKDTGKPRTLAGVYEFFDKKFRASNGTSNAVESDKPQTPLRREHNGPSAADILNQLTATLQSHDRSVNAFLGNLFGSSDESKTAGIFGGSALLQSPVELMMLAELKSPYETGR